MLWATSPVRILAITGISQTLRLSRNHNEAAYRQRLHTRGETCMKYMLDLLMLWAELMLGDDSGLAPYYTHDTEVQ